ncbi:MAG: hypothetical protein A2Y33_16715 [Spirochaetes bacterium GWF1_51_8]|nr:MAG: hypothetical protein A2Y33_16715 [Spirochaetes bacterium GWF1_51_8]
MDRAERWVWFCAFLLAAAASFYFFFNSKLLLDKLSAQTNMGAVSQSQPDRPDSLDLSKFDIKVMTGLGLTNPVSNLIADLSMHPELIPFKGQLGGKYGFYNPGKYIVLNSKWVYAPVDDGHNMGYILFEYTVKKGGTIEWKVAASFSDYDEE